jgi:hypothetical protein
MNLKKFHYFVYFLLNFRFPEKIEGPQKRASRATCGLAEVGLDRDLLDLDFRSFSIIF